MNVMSRPTLVEFWTRYPAAERPLEAWYATVTSSTYTGPADIQTAFGGNVDFVKDNRAIFDIGGNKFRLVAHFSYTFKACNIKFVGTHEEYDRIDASTVGLYYATVSRITQYGHSPHSHRGRLRVGHE